MHIALIFGLSHHLVDLYQVCSNYCLGTKNGPRSRSLLFYIKKDNSAKAKLACCVKNFTFLQSYYIKQILTMSHDCSVSPTGTQFYIMVQRVLKLNRLGSFIALCAVIKEKKEY